MMNYQYVWRTMARQAYVHRMQPYPSPKAVGESPREYHGTGVETQIPHESFEPTMLVVANPDQNFLLDEADSTNVHGKRTRRERDLFSGQPYHLSLLRAGVLGAGSDSDLALPPVRVAPLGFHMSPREPRGAVEVVSRGTRPTACEPAEVPGAAGESRMVGGANELRASPDPPTDATMVDLFRTISIEDSMLEDADMTPMGSGVPSDPESAEDADRAVAGIEGPRPGSPRALAATGYTSLAEAADWNLVEDSFTQGAAGAAPCRTVSTTAKRARRVVGPRAGVRWKPLAPMASFPKVDLRARLALQSLLEDAPEPGRPRLADSPEEARVLCEGNELRERDWTKEFQTALLLPDTVERGLRLHMLSQDFAEEAKRIGKIIIQERNVTVEEKRIRPLEEGSIPDAETELGSAGGEKYLHNNIFFKYAIDANGLYGEDVKSAMKVAGHELKGLTAYASQGMLLGMSFGLVCLIDYGGYRLIASSKLPISQETLVYGSADGGNTVYAENRRMNKMIKDCNTVLNLKGHVAGVGRHPKYIYGPCDQEGHVGTDGHFYVIDLSRVFPPETPDISTKGSFMFRLLRPELVAKYPVPLSSDAFTYFGRHGRRAQHDAEVTRATEWLREQVIPQAALEISARFESVMAHSATGLQRSDPAWLVSQVHQEGINLRYLGHLYGHMTNEHLRVVALTEMCARVLKHIVRSDMRAVTCSGEDALRRAILDSFNRIFGDSLDTYYLWDVTLLERLRADFGFSPNAVNFSLRSAVEQDILFARLQEMTGAVFSTRLPLGGSDALEFLPQDLVELNVCLKMMYAISRMEADSILSAANNLAIGEERTKYLQVALDMYKAVLALKPDDIEVLTTTGSIHVGLAQMLALVNRPQAEVDTSFSSAYEAFSSSVRLQGEEVGSRTFALWGDCICRHACTLLESTSPVCITRINGLLEKALTLLEQAFRATEAEGNPRPDPALSRTVDHMRRLDEQFTQGVVDDSALYSQVLKLLDKISNPSY